MSSPDEPKRPLPSADEINAYLELSAARTKKRLTLAFGTTGTPKRPVARDRKLPVAGAPKPEPAPELSRVVEFAPDAVQVDAMQVDAMQVDAVQVDAVQVDAVEPSKGKPSGG